MLVVIVLTSVMVLMSVIVLKSVMVFVAAAGVIVTVEAAGVDAVGVPVDAEAIAQVDPEALVIVTIEVAAPAEVTAQLDSLPEAVTVTIEMPEEP